MFYVANSRIVFHLRGFRRQICSFLRVKVWLLGLTCEEVLCVEQFAGNFSFQLVEFVSVWRQASLPVNPTLAQPAGVQSVGAHPQKDSPLQDGRRTRWTLVCPPQARETVQRQRHHLRASGRQVVLLRRARHEVAALRTGDGHLPHQSLPYVHRHVETEICEREKSISNLQSWK